ncbi:MAG: ABC transporter permease, partial [Candidatus Thalassarchaeaceae archaeon]|nr:ABC transporter permease [Candidatus Thalassarchaeaceae archaeon]
MDSKGKSLSETVWTRMDRKAGAIIELTMRQLRHRISTWVVLGVGVLLMALLLTFYIDAVRESFEPIDNDGDSADNDGDGYPMGQERKYGTPDWNADLYPGASVYIPESDIDWNDADRSVFGNKSWEGSAFFEVSWIDDQYTGEWWDSHVKWNVDPEGTPELTDCSEWELDEILEAIWGDACDLGDDDGDGMTTYYVAGKWRGEGIATVPENYYLSWGYWTEEVYVEPEPPEMYINEDGIDCFEGLILRGPDWGESRVDCPSEARLSGSHGFDDDGDCLADDDGEGNDDNENGITCDVQWFSSNGVVTRIEADYLVDEDPDEQEYIGELDHRTFVIAVGKMAFVILLGLFIPLFLSLGLVRDETENGTLHLLLSKPIHRAEFIIYRLTGYLAISGSYVIALSLVVGVISSILGPGEQLIRLADLPVWIGIGVATTLVLAAYGSMFNAMGLISPKYGVYLCIVFGIWEFMMGSFSILNPNWTVASVSISHWALQMIDAIVLLAWPDTIQWAEMDRAFEIDSGLSVFWQPPVHTLGTASAGIALLNSVIVLLAV